MPFRCLTGGSLPEPPHELSTRTLIIRIFLATKRSVAWHSARAKMHSDDIGAEPMVDLAAAPERVRTDSRMAARRIGRPAHGRPRPWRLGRDEAALVEALPIVLYRAEAQQFAGPRQVGSALADALGLPSRAFVESPDLWPSRIHPEDRPRVLAHLAAARGREPVAIEYRIMCADGSERVFLDRGSWSKGTDASTPLHGVCLDITVRRQLEQRLLWSERLEAAGRYLRTQGHDMMNMLSVIQLNLEGMQRSMNADKIDGREGMRVARALSGVDRSVASLQRLMSFTSRLSSKSRQIDVPALLLGMDGLIRAVVGERVRLRLDLTEGLWPTRADRSQIEAALIALATHARQGMTADGELVISARNETRTQAIADLAAGDYVTLTIRGGGEGRAIGAFEHVFERANGSCDQNRMAQVHGIARHWGGQLMSLGGDPEHATMRLLLPRLDLPAKA
ncbi:MAG TPA: PAS domain-containing protein [Stellaceae bacterium]|nr:PAS domain-containing protein [Stellaceae bacterium]